MSVLAPLFAVLVIVAGIQQIFIVRLWRENRRLIKRYILDQEGQS